MKTIAILGHQGHGKTTLAQAITGYGAPFAVGDPADWAQAAQWGGAILVVSAPDGCMPGTREALVHAQAAGVRTVVGYLGKCDLIDPTDTELIDLVQMEVAELLNKYGYPDVPVVRGSAQRAMQGGHSHSQPDRSISEVIAAVSR